MSAESHKCYCAFCKHERRVYKKKHITVMNVFLSLLASVLLMFVLWGDVDAKVVLLFATGLCLAEVFILLRWRLSIACPYCGFDPVLYKKSPEECANKVKNFLETRKQMPEIYLHAKNPFHHLQPVKKTRLYKAAPASGLDTLQSGQSVGYLSRKRTSPALRGE